MHLFDRAHRNRAADWLAVAVGFTLPISTSAASIAIALWLVTVLTTVEIDGLRDILRKTAAYIPIILVLLAALGMLWSDVTMAERLRGFRPFPRLLVIPLLFYQFSRSDRGPAVFAAFLAACVFLLAASGLHVLWPAMPKSSPDPGVFTKSYIAQSAEFTICAFILLYLTFDFWRERRLSLAVACVALAAAFLVDIFYIVTSRTTLVVIPILLLLFAWKLFGLRGLIGGCAALALLATVLWFSSPYLRDRVVVTWQNMQEYSPNTIANPTSERIEFWRKSVEFIKQAPVLGHGTGSVADQFRRAADGNAGVSAIAPNNPHNLTFAVAIQLGLLGASILWAMWIVHAGLFTGTGLAAWAGIVIVGQNIVGSLFNSYLFDFTESWIYIFGVGIAGGMVLRQRGEAAPDRRA